MEFLSNIYYAVCRFKDDIYSWYRCRFIHQRHIIKVAKPLHWYDSDFRILYGMMQVLVDFIEEEKPQENINWDWCEEHARIRDEFMFIYAWWKNHPNRLQEIDDVTSKWSESVGPMKFKKSNIKDGYYEFNSDPHTEEQEVLFKRIAELESKLHDEETEMLTKLIKIRSYLWT